MSRKRPRYSKSTRSLKYHVGEASSVWRRETLRDLEWRVRCLGLEVNSEVQGLLAELLKHSSEVESLWQQQQDPSYNAPWWADGEYDDANADRSAESIIYATCHLCWPAPLLQHTLVQARALKVARQHMHGGSLIKARAGKLMYDTTCVLCSIVAHTRRALQFE